MKPLRLLPALALLLAVSAPLPARADTSPDFFVSPDECRATSPECKCSDAPFLELFLKDRNKALDGWDAAADTLDMAGGPTTQEALVKEFFKLYKADARIISQFTSCPDFDPALNTTSKFAGISISRGGAVIDPCFCQQFCSEIIDAVAAHEDRHFAFTLEALVDLMTSKVACGVGSLDQSYCDTIDARLLARSEQYAYTVETESLYQSLDDLRASDPDNPDMECTWEPLPEMAARVMPAPPPAPAGFWDRVQMLASRLLHGRSSSTG
jgi:hypothetical protein